MKKYIVKANVTFPIEAVISARNKADAYDKVRNIVSFDNLCEDIVNEIGVIVDIIVVKRRK